MPRAWVLPCLVVVQLFPAQQLGSLRDQVEQTRLGTIEVTQQPAAILSLFVPKVMLLDFRALHRSMGTVPSVN
jgi:TRAP-type C4-dicarboxylate transport system substrate-binding protein